jgi:hypothetical protein
MSIAEMLDHASVLGTPLLSPATGPSDAKRAWVAQVLGVETVSVKQAPVLADYVARSDALHEEAPGTNGAAVRLAKGMLLWNTVRAHVDDRIKVLQQAIVEQSQDESDFDEIKMNVGNLSIVLEHLDARLSHTLDALRATADTAQKQALSQKAREIVSDYQTYIETSSLMADIDDNGFVPIDVQAKTRACLTAILATI